jgi:predicted RNase H-like nuclease
VSAVLGIDAAWTQDHPSGVALAIHGKSGWRLQSVAASYEKFLSLEPASDKLSERVHGTMPEPRKLLEVARRKAGIPISLVAVDMPLSTKPITKRRKADDDVSRCFGGKGAGTHSPNSKRPGKVGEALGHGFEAEGYPIATSAPLGHALIEVYPHPALIILDNADQRLLYKVRKYKKAHRKELIAVWHRIVSLLDNEISGCVSNLSLPSYEDPLHRLKAFEDILDAVVCCWVGICALEGRAVALGDDAAAIWVPECGGVRQFRKTNGARLIERAQGMIQSGIADLATNQKAS